MLGWKHQMKSPTKSDNTNTPAKIALRKVFLKYIDNPKILECFAGVERKMKVAYEGYETTALDLKKSPGVKRIDNKIFVSKHADDFNYFDMDAYGSPYELMITLFAKRTISDTFVVIITDGMKLNLNYQHASNIIQTTANLPSKIQVPSLYLFQKELIWYVLKAASKRYNITITHPMIVNGETGNMQYYGFVASKA